MKHIGSGIQPMNDIKKPLDRVPSADTLDIAQVFSAGTMKTLAEVIKPHLEVGKRKIVYIFPASDAIGHISGEMHILWSLYGKGFDEILVVIGARHSSPMLDGPARVVSQYVTFVETTDSNVMLMGHYTIPPQNFDLFELRLTNATSLWNAYYPSLSRGPNDISNSRPIWSSKARNSSTVWGGSLVKKLSQCTGGK
jgi:hypothetical protein